MASQSKKTRDHDEIREWAESRGGKPATVASTHNAEDVGLIRIDFPGFSGEGSLEEITWEEFFEKFDEQGLTLLYQETTADGTQSNFNKLIRDVEFDDEPSGGTAAKRSGSRPPAKKAAKKAGKKTAVKKAAAKKAPAKKTVAKKAAAKKAVKKATAKKAVKKSPAKKKAAKKAARR